MVRRRAGDRQAADPKLRRRAEHLLGVDAKHDQGISAGDHNTLVHELMVHQMELEVQNEELRQTQLELAHTRDRYTDLYEFAPVGYLLLGRNGVIREANLTAAKLLASQRASLIGRKLSGFIARESQDVLFLCWRRALESGMQVTGEVRVKRSSAPDFDAQLDIMARVEQVPQDAATEVKVTLSDVSERKKAERAIRKLNEQLEVRVSERTQDIQLLLERMRTILNTATDAIITIDRRGIITAVNPATGRMFGYREDELLGHDVKILMPSPYREEHDGYIARYLETRMPSILGTGREVLGRRKDGSTFPMDLAVNEVQDLGLFTAVARDISDRKELQRLVLEIAAEEDRRIGHELHEGVQQEMTALALFAGSLRDALGTAEMAEVGEREVRLLEEATYSRLQELAAKLCRGLAGTHAHVQRLSRGILPVQIAAHGLDSALANLAASTNVPGRVACRFEASGEVEVADNTTATHLYRIAQEAVNNALRHGGGSEVNLLLERRDGQLILEVHDNGVWKDPGARRLPEEERGIGLRAMHYRAGLIGGTLRIGRGGRDGTRVTCTVIERHRPHDDRQQAGQDPDR